MAKKSRLGRMMRLGGLTSKVSSSYLGQRITGAFQKEEQRKESLYRTHLKNAERVVDAMSVLKGAAMKVGQSLSVLADSMDIPAEVSQILGKLHDRAKAIPYEKIEPVILKELGCDISKVFSKIDPDPLGTASLAQAHAAWLLDGTPVVIKVLHEGVEHSVDTDLTALKSILIAGRFFKRSKEEIDLIFNEIRTRLLEELDYTKELQNLVYFHRIFSDIEGLSAPKPVPELSTKRILVMERMVGVNLDEFVKTASSEVKQRAGDILTRAFHEQVYVYRSLHADPHGGNFLFAPDGSVGFIDFGCVKRFDEYFIGDYGRIANSLVDGNRVEMISLAKKMEMLNSDNPAAADALWDFGEIIAQPFRQGDYHAGTEGDRLMDEIRSAGHKIIKFSEIRAPRDLIFLHRSLIGIYSMLRRLSHKSNYEEIRRKYTEHAIDVVEGRVLDRGWNEV